MSQQHKTPPKKVELDVVRMNRVKPLDEEELEKLYMWVDEIPLSRPKKNMIRDFSDGVLVAEVLKYFLPHLVDLHNYTPSSNNRHKADNWFHFNRKVLTRLNTELSHDVIQAICSCKPNVVESVLCILREKIDLFLAGQMQQQRPTPRRRDIQNINDLRPEADQDYGRGYIPSAEGFYQDGQMQQAPTRSSPGKSQYPPQQQGNLTGRGGKQEMLPKMLLDEREAAIESREQTIQMLTSKVQRLEQLLRLKDMRIEDLTQKLDQLMQPTFQAPQRMTSNRLQAGNRQTVGRF